jgi:GT2 family glycosyltransferase
MRLRTSTRRAPGLPSNNSPCEKLGRPVIHGKGFLRDGRKLRIQGVTYGPFSPNAEGIQFPDPNLMRLDFARMRESGFNAARTYVVPPPQVFDLAAAHDILLFVDIPWSKHVCFLESRVAQQEAHDAVRAAAGVGRRHANVLAYSIGNEIPTEIIRWYGSRRIERFLGELQDEVKQLDPEACVTYASFPPTEYLDLSFLDFVTFNVYLHRLETFRRYLFRLQNAVGDRPLILGELGMDSQRHGEEAQAEFLAGHVAELRLMGLAGSFVFSWTDDWHTGGEQVLDWSFGITRRDRSPKPSCRSLRLMHGFSLSSLILQTPRVSVIVCTYNGGRTLEQCLRSLMALSYPDYEVIVVDDGSTDESRKILERFRSVRVIHQPNLGLSAARNMGLSAANGEIVAYTDSDCFVDTDWLTHLVYQLQRTDAAAVGGPNLTPDDGRLAACIAACPGQPTHVLESDQQAEHIPGCNMAFYRDALEQIHGFDPQFRKAGDDVDICWRLQQAGHWITFSPGACVWHHRRQGPRSYLKQQTGYGEAEALLQFKHPERFNRRGESKWRGVLYGIGLRGLRLGRPLIYRGTFASGMFQCLYQPGASHWVMLPTTLEWHATAALIAVAGMGWPRLLLVAALMILVSLILNGLRACQATIPKQYDGWTSRLVVFTFTYLQPLVRSCYRYRTRLFYFHPGASTARLADDRSRPFPVSGSQSIAYWSENARDRLEILQLAVEFLKQRRWGRIVDSGWTDWDLRIYCHPLIYLQVRTTQENHGGNKRLVRLQQKMRLRDVALVAMAAFALACLLVAGSRPMLAGAFFTLGALTAAFLWFRATSIAGKAAAIFDRAASELRMVRCDARDQLPAGSIITEEPVRPAECLISEIDCPVMLNRAHIKT